MNLSAFLRPSRYINNELNSVHKQAPLKVALAFPDVYEVGMSHLGLKVLYHIVNSLPFALAERVFSPWTDLEEAMKKEGLLLSSLESSRPLRDFDVVGFSLQYELCYTTVLNMLSMGGIPLRSEERNGREGMPLIIAGGPCTLNPHPMSPFIDAFLIGDGEEAVPEMLGICHRWKTEGDGKRESLLSGLSGVEGVYVPSLGRDRTVKRRIIASLEEAPFPVCPVLPFTGIVHDRVNIEISRGCSQGCRFCQAGMAYRPVRERSPEKVLALAEESLRNTGYEDISFTSLSSGDYSCLPDLMREFNRRFSERRISMSLPSLRVATVNLEMLREIRAVRKTGFTIAPEAATERLRAVINKDFTDETYTRALETLFKEGWQNLKLYFMSGLPTETWEDIEAIPEMVLRAIRISKQLTGRNVNISVGVSSFIPKPHTPFQWAGQNSTDLLREKNSWLKREFLRKGVKFKGHDEDMSLLEAVFARGDDRLSGLIETAWSLGCRLDAWTEVFDFGKWKEALAIMKIDAAEYASREYGKEDSLPWSNIDTGVSQEFLWKEYWNALSGSYTRDCRSRCVGCGLACSPVEKSRRNECAGADNGLKGGPSSPKKWAKELQHVSVKVRLEYQKAGKARYLSHLELMRAMVRAMRRAEFPLKYSSGFHPAPRVSFGPALGVGLAGMKEYLDIELIPPFDVEDGLRRLRATLPAGLDVMRMSYLRGNEKSLDSFVSRYVYEVRNGDAACLEDFIGKPEMIAMREDVPVDIRKMVEEAVRIDEKTFRITVCDIGQTKVRLSELLPAVFGHTGELDVTRTALFGWDSGWVEPIESEKEWAARS